MTLEIGTQNRKFLIKNDNENKNKLQKLKVYFEQNNLKPATPPLSNFVQEKYK